MVSFLRLVSQVLAWGRGVVAFALLVFLSLLMRNGTIQQKQNVVDTLLSTLFFPAQSLVSKVTSVKDLDAENYKLKNENARLRLENDVLRQAKAEAIRLRRMVGFESPWTYPVSLAQVVGRNPGQYLTTLVINRGYKEGVNKDMPVFTSTGLVGRISKVFDGHSMVQLLSDPNMKVSTIAQRTRTVGILESQDGEHLQVMMPSHADLRLGDTLVTSGLGGVFPKGIFVGIIAGLTDSDIEVVRYGHVRPMQNPALLEEVFVINKEPDWVVRGIAP